MKQALCVKTKKCEIGFYLSKLLKHQLLVFKIFSVVCINCLQKKLNQTR